MSTGVVTVIFFALVSALAFLPLLPAIREWLRPADLEPLRVGQFSAVDARLFARGFRLYVEDTVLARASESGSAGVDDRLPDGTSYLLADADGRLPLSAQERTSKKVRRLVSGKGNVRLGERLRYLREVYAPGDVAVEDRAVVRAAMADGNIHMGPGSRSLRWLHANGQVTADEESVLHGRVTADRRITLRPRATFERMNAPRIEFGGPREVASMEVGHDSVELVPWRPEDVPHLQSTVAGRWLVDGDLQVPGSALIEADVVVTGACRVGSGALLRGSLKSHGDLVLEDRVQVEGSAVTERALTVGPRGRIGGPVVAEEDVLIGEDCTIGGELRPTTVSAPRIAVSDGVVVHGTVWARVEGKVVSETSPTPGDAHEAGFDRREAR